MNPLKQLTRAMGLAAMAAVVVGFASPATASPVPPKADGALIGTWVNVNAGTRSVKQVIVTPRDNGSVSVDAFGSCSPTLCEWGNVPAIVYSTSVSATSGLTFQTDQSFLSGRTEWSRTTLLGSVRKTALGLRLTLRELTVFEDGSNRKNYNVTEQFALGRPSKPARVGVAATGYRRGTPPALTAAAFGTWTNPVPTGGLVGLTITGTLANPVVQALGQCAPTPCNWGRTSGITFGPSISATVGGTLLAPYTFGFKNSQLLITFYRTATGQRRLSVAEYNEFTDGSGRSNYTKVEGFVHA